MYGQYVFPRRALLTEPLITMRTGIWFQTVVDSLMFLQHRFTPKPLRAVWALMVPNLQMVSVDVLIQITSPLKRRSIRSLRTLIANIRPLDTVHVVHVTPEMDISMKHFPANSTFNAQLIFVRFEM